MMIKNILVTGAGGDSGIAVIRILKEKGFYVHACDCDESSPGLFLADSYSIIPKASEKKAFLNAIEKIIKNKKIEVVFPNVDEELGIFAEYKDKLSTNVIISKPRTIQICQDKLEAINHFKSSIDVPKTNQETGFPVVVRPVVSRGSRNIYIAKDEKEKSFFIEYLKSMGLSPMYQEYLPGKEYTIDCLCDKGKLIVAAPRERISTKGSVCSVGRNTKDERILKIVKKITDRLEFDGPINIQLKEDKNGVLKLLEINPRCSGGLPITYQNGLNLPVLAIKLIEGEKIKPEELDYKEETVFRYLKEIKK